MTLHQSTRSTDPAPAKNGPGAADGFDLYRLDCAVDALRDAHLTTADRAELARIAANLADIMEPLTQ